MSQTWDEAVEMVVSIILDAGRIDRYLRVDDGGEYYTSADKTYLGNDGPYTPPYVHIPYGGDISDEDAAHWADSLLRELDEEAS